MQPPRVEIVSVDGIGEIVTGDDLARIVGDAVAPLIGDGDIIVITSKIVSKAEGRVVDASDRERAIESETVRIVAEKKWVGGSTRIVENRLGMIQAAAGVDASNTPDGTVLLLPLDPDASARTICQAVRDRFNLTVGVIITDTMGRPWRLGQTDVAIGAAGVKVIEDLGGTKDDFGQELLVTSAAVADEIAGAANLVAGKTSRRPVTIVKGLSHLITGLETERGPSARDLLRPRDDDLFHTGSRESYNLGFEAGKQEGEQ